MSRFLLLLALAGACLAVRAQTIDELRLVTEGNRQIARIVFNADVRFLQQSPVTVSDLFRVDFEIVAADESLRSQTTFEAKLLRVPPPANEVMVSYAPAPSQRVKQLTVQIRSKLALQVRQGPTARTIDIVLAEPAQAAAPPREAPQPKPAAAPPIAPASEKRYGVSLQTLALRDKDKVRPIPSRFQDYEVLNIDSVVNGVPSFEVVLGYFATEKEAEAARQALLDRFPEARTVDLAKRREEVLQSASAQAKAGGAAVPAQPAAPAAPGAPTAPAQPTPPVAAAPAEQPAPPRPQALPEVEQRATELMKKARQALTAKKYDEAIDALNQLLLLPPNDKSQEAQELIGVAWERAGNLDRARTEYSLYLKLFPQGEGADRVAQRLAALAPEAPAAAPGASATAAARPAPARRITGSIGQYYYGGIARSQSLVNLAAGIDQSTLSRTTQSAIVTSADLAGRYDSENAETRVVLRGTGSTNLKASSHNSSLLSAAYADYRRTDNGFAIRAGRQSAVSGGLLGLFDGVSMAYPVRPGLVLDVMGGQPANQLVSTPSERLYAAMLEATTLFERWSGDIYLIDQTSQGITNRRALGTEVRYSGAVLSGYSLLDYDTNFRKLNAASLQASLLAPGQTAITLLVDQRKAPSLELTNALISTGATSLKTLLQMQTLAQVRDAALATTADARQALFSVSRPIAERWQFSGDVRYSEVGALPAVGNFTATPATGAQFTYSLQFTGSNLYSPRDINGFNLSYITSPFFHGGQIAYNNLTGLRGNQITLEPSIRYYLQHDDQGTRLVRWTPSVRLSYRLTERASLLGESIFERSTTDGPLNHDRTNSVFFYLGYRYGVY